MELIWHICLQSLSIFVLILGIVGLAVSLLLVISPNTAKSLSNTFNKYVIIDKKLTYLNKPIQTDSFTYQHNILTGLSLVCGSIFFLVFLFFRFDMAKTLNVFLGHNYLFLYEIVLKTTVLIGKIAGFTGVVIGLCLLFLPDIMVKIENRMDAWIATQDIADKLDEFHLGIDNIILRFPLLFGFTGLMTSAVLIILSIASLLSK
ncbi:MAG: hypothetical protein P1P89_08110 [Desulfobacterales bacterium]|nr:hypothetical protein [Desulfobacterales bacterium]